MNGVTLRENPPGALKARGCSLPHTKGVHKAGLNQNKLKRYKNKIRTASLCMLLWFGEVAKRQGEYQPFLTNWHVLCFFFFYFISILCIDAKLSLTTAYIYSCLKNETYIFLEALLPQDKMGQQWNAQVIFCNIYDCDLFLLQYVVVIWFSLSNDIHTKPPMGHGGNYFWATFAFPRNTFDILTIQKECKSIVREHKNIVLLQIGK